MSPPPAAAASLVVVAAESRRQADGIRDYTERLVEALSDAEVFAPRLVLRTPGAGWAGARGSRLARALGLEPLPAELEGADVVLVQYNPFSYGRRGFAPGLPLLLWRLRRRRRPVLAIMFHETYVDPESWRWALMGGWQRLQLQALQRCADVQLCSIERWTDRLRRLAPRVPAEHLPVGSNLPDRRALRVEARQELGAQAGTLVLACFGLWHPGRLAGHVFAASRSVARGRHTILLNLGAPHRTAGIPPVGVDLREPGFMSGAALARLLAAADIVLAPYEDGVSTRRSTVMAALQHGIPVVGTAGHLTDRLLAAERDALVLVPVDDPARFANAVVALADDPQRLGEAGRAARRLYESRFDWPVIVERLTGILRAARRDR